VLQPRPLLNPTEKVGITLSVGFILLLTVAMPLPPKPDQSEMPIFFKLAEAGAGLQQPKSFCYCFPKNKTGSFLDNEVSSSRSIAIG